MQGIVSVNCFIMKYIAPLLLLAALGLALPAAAQISIDEVNAEE